MRLSDVTAYAGKTYAISEDFKWPKWPSFSVLASPVNGQWFALLIYKHANAETGEIEECCDIRCGDLKQKLIGFYGFSDGIRMKGPEWLGVTMGPQTNAELVKQALDQALWLVSHPGENGIIVAPAPAPKSEQVYGATAIPKSVSFTQEEIRSTPKPILKMMQLYDAKDFSVRQKYLNFYVQGKYLEDYEDSCAWNGTLNRYFPVYHDLRIEQLRGYFTWRTRFRKGIYEKTCPAFLYLYLYEILNQIGVSTPEDGYDRLREIRDHLEELADNDPGIQRSLKKWMPEYAVYYDLPVERAQAAMDPQMLASDEALAVLRNAGSASPEAIYQALSVLYRGKPDANPLVRKEPERGHALFARIWTYLEAVSAERPLSLFAQCFGKQEQLSWRPFGDAVFHHRKKEEDRVYTVDASRFYTVHNGNWTLSSFPESRFNIRFFNAVMHEADRVIRDLLHTGHPLKEQHCADWVSENIPKAVKAFLEEEAEAARPKIHIDLSRLDTIREDAGITRERLLTEEERAEEAAMKQASVSEEAPAAEDACSRFEELDLTADEAELLKLLLEDQPVLPFLKERHLMASVITDAVNEKLFEAIGDAVLESDGREISVIEDYRMDLNTILKGE